MTRKPRGYVADRDVIGVLEERGFRVLKDHPHEPRIDIPLRPGGAYRWAVVACTHLGGKFQQLTHLKDFCKRAVEVYGVSGIFHAGALLMGSSRRHDYVHEAFIHGATAQHDYAAENLPPASAQRWLGVALVVTGAYGLGVQQAPAPIERTAAAEPTAVTVLPSL
jgi:hypothetical protein